MALNLFHSKGCPLDQQRFTWRDMVGKPISKLDDDAFTRVRIILMNGIENDAIRFQHTAARMSRELRLSLAQIRRTEQHQATTVNWLLGADHSPLESAPVPGTIKGAMTTGFSMLTGNQPQLLLDKLGERLAFERTGTRLYDALIAKFEAIGQGATSMTLDDLRKIRDEEARHFAVVANAIESVGGDPTSLEFLALERSR